LLYNFFYYDLIVIFGSPII